MPYRFHLSLMIEDDLVADDIDDAWEIIRGRVEDRFYGPTVQNITVGEEVEEEAAPAEET